MPSIWRKYQKIELMDSNSKIKTYKAKIEPIIKEIIPEDKEEFYRIKEKLKFIEQNYEIIEMIEQEDKFYIVINKDDEIIYKIDNLLLTDDLYIKKESKIEDHGNVIPKSEIFNIFKKESAMCKIVYENIDKGLLESGHGSGFFCEIEGNFPIKYALFTNNHVLNETNLEIGKIIKFKYFDSKKSNNSNNIIEKSIKLTIDRKTFTNEELDYTCIEIFKSDGIHNFFKIEPHILFHESKNSSIFKEYEIFILQFLNENEISFSNGKIKNIKDNTIYHLCSTEPGSSGSPIIIRDKNNKDNYVIGLHKASYSKGNINLNLGVTFDSILDNILKIKINEISCVYVPDKDKKEIYLMHDYNRNISEFVQEKNKEIYLQAKNLNKSIFENNIELYVNDKKIKFNFKYKCNDSNEIKVRFKFNKTLKNMSYMFYGCSHLKSIKFFSFNTNEVNNMSAMFQKCSSLKSLNLSSFNTNNVNDMSFMFCECSSLENINLSSFDTSKVNSMRTMFQKCSSLKSLNLSSFNTINVNDMSYMFNECSSLTSLDLSSFNIRKVNNMTAMFQKCSSLKSLNLLSFNTYKVNDMSSMFNKCCSLENIDLSSFNSNNVYNMRQIFQKCTSLKSLDLSSFNTNNVNDMSSMFNECSSLENINLSSFNTSKVNNMSAMFQNCSSLKSINLSSFNTNNVSDMSYMFNKCFTLKSLDLSSFNLKNVKKMNLIMGNCSLKIKNKKNKIMQNIDIKNLNQLQNFLIIDN